MISEEPVLCTVSINCPVTSFAQHKSRASHNGKPGRLFVKIYRWSTLYVKNGVVCELKIGMLGQLVQATSCLLHGRSRIEPHILHFQRHGLRNNTLFHPVHQRDHTVSQGDAQSIVAAVGTAGSQEEAQSIQALVLAAQAVDHSAVYIHGAAGEDQFIEGAMAEKQLAAVGLECRDVTLFTLDDMAEFFSCDAEELLVFLPGHGLPIPVGILLDPACRRTRGDSMGKPKDRRVRKTKSAIRRSFAELIEQKPVQQITVQELVDRADLSRGTFYQHYQDIYDLKDRIEDEVFEELVQEANDYAMQFEQEEPYPYLVGTLNYIVNNSSVCKMLLSQNGSKNFCDRLVQIEEETVLTEWIEPLKTQYDAVLLSYYSRFDIYGFASVVIKWLEDDMPESPGELADMLGHIMDFGLDAMLKRPAKGT